MVELKNHHLNFSRIEGVNMKESRLIIIFSIVLAIITMIMTILMNYIWPNSIDYIGVLTNIYCGIIVGLVTSICQYFVQKRKIINNVYSAYFDIYRSYYYSKNRPFLFHYNSFSIYKKLIDLNPKIIEALDEYHGFFKKHDKTYKKLNPTINLGDNYKVKKVVKSIFCWFNKKYFDSSVEPLVFEIEKILTTINNKRFEKDKEEMIKLYNYSFDIKNNKINSIV